MNAKTIGNAISDTLNSFMGSDFTKNVKITVAQLNENMADLARRNKLKGVPFIGKNIEQTTIDDVAEMGAKLKAAGVTGSGNKNFGQFRKMFEEAAEDAPDIVDLSSATGSNIKEKIGAVNYFANIPKAYLNTPNAKVKNDRITAMVGGYAGAAVGMRVLRGGTITHNEYGQQDIAGIPFV